MNTLRAPKVIMVIFYRSATDCQLLKIDLSSKSLSLFTLPLRRNGPYQSQIKLAHQFVVENYLTGDHVMIYSHSTAGKSSGYTHHFWRFSKQTVNQSDPDKVYLRAVYVFVFFAGEVPNSQALRWSLVQRALSNFPSTVENLLCISYFEGYVVQRGSNSQITRKEAWLGSNCIPSIDWLVLQTSHIIKYDPRDLKISGYSSESARSLQQPKLLSMMSFAEDQYNEVYNAPLIGPRPL
ncbi:hypothetical protein BDV93DRAFT_510784 [Ceratobasidium sp. AG-I]|nr:hypothetical protein BDV93DRAFT_510784 [Ceratobasidium sp. AG-I]